MGTEIEVDAPAKYPNKEIFGFKTDDAVDVALVSAYRDALFVQTACNLRGILFSLEQHRKTLCAATMDTEAFNKHPVMVLFAEQIYHLTGGGSKYHEAHAIASEKLLAEKP